MRKTLTSQIEHIKHLIESIKYKKKIFTNRNVKVESELSQSEIKKRSEQNEKKKIVKAQELENLHKHCQIIDGLVITTKKVSWKIGCAFSSLQSSVKQVEP